MFTKSDPVEGKEDEWKVVIDNSDNIKSVTIPEGVTIIMWDAFKDCKNLESVILPDSLTEIKNLAFFGCEKLTSVELSENLKLIRWGLFRKLVLLR